jgi:hypothetical protein
MKDIFTSELYSTKSIQLVDFIDVYSATEKFVNYYCLVSMYESNWKQYATGLIYEIDSNYGYNYGYGLIKFKIINIRDVEEKDTKIIIGRAYSFKINEENNDKIIISHDYKYIENKFDRLMALE